MNLGAEKLKCIRELGYGINAKVMNGTTSRSWRGSDTGLPAPSNGTFYSDLGFQTLWDTSRAQPGDAGIITNYLGAKPGLTDAKSALDAFRADLPKMSQKMADSLDPNAVTSWFWAVYPFTLGSYASAKVGQYHAARCGAGTGPRWAFAICRRAHKQRVSRLHERWRAKRKPRLRRVHKDHGTAQINGQARRPSEQLRDGCFPMALGPVLD
ncbi:MAG: FAD-dependent oxidoreductase [Pseudolabrys sp.]